MKQHESMTAPTFAELFERAVDANVTQVKSLAIAGEVSTETIAAIMGRREGGPRDPHSRIIRNWLRSPFLPGTLKAQILEILLRGTGYRAAPVADADLTTLDADGSGIVDARDVLAHEAAALSKATDALGQITHAIQDGRFNEAESANVRSLLFEVEERTRLARQTLDAQGKRTPSKLRVV